MVVSKIYKLLILGASLMVSSCAATQEYPISRMQYLVGASRNVLEAKLGPPHNEKSYNDGKMLIWYATYRNASAQVGNANCQFIFIVNKEQNVESLDMSGRPEVCNDYIDRYDFDKP